MGRAVKSESAASTRRTLAQPSYVFPAIEGQQAGAPYWVAMIPLRLVSRLFVFDEEELRPELRAQRVLNRSRLPEIVAYLAENPTSYIFSALTASIDGELRFHPEGAPPQSSIGTLEVSMTSRIVINDGQHRRAAIEEVLKVRPELGNETIAVVMFADAGLERSQQMFADLNTHAVRPSMSISILYDHRDPLAALVRDLMESVPIFVSRVETEKSSISNRSLKVFTLSALYQATASLLGVRRGGSLSARDATTARRFWNTLSGIFTEWGDIAAGRLSPAEFRAEYVHAHGVVLEALGRAGAELITQPAWPQRLERLRSLDWRRTNRETWEGRALIGGKVSKSHQSVVLTTNLIKRTLGLALTTEERKAEEQGLRDGAVPAKGATDAA